MSWKVGNAGREIPMPSALCANPLLPGSLTVLGLTNEQQDEVLDFLSLRPIHTVCMASFIRENGVVSPDNRGIFYGCRSESGTLEGVALIGHATLFETQNDEALKAFAMLKQHYHQTHLIRGEDEMISRFWHYYSGAGHEPRLGFRELLLEQKAVTEVEGPAPQLQPATLERLGELLEINSEFVVAQSGVDPLKKDPVGFRKRMRQRIERERVWVCLENDRLLFKADIFAETPEMAYVEGVYVHPDSRGRGHGLRCLTQLGRLLLTRSKSACLMVNEHRKNLVKFYEKAGFQQRGVYRTIYLTTEGS